MPITIDPRLANVLWGELGLRGLELHDHQRTWLADVSRPGARIIIASTPCRRDGVFYDLVKAASAETE